MRPPSQAAELQDLSLVLPEPPTSETHEPCLISTDRSTPTRDPQTFLRPRRLSATRTETLRSRTSVPTSTRRASPARLREWYQMHLASPPMPASGARDRHATHAVRDAGPSAKKRFSKCVAVGHPHGLDCLTQQLIDRASNARESSPHSRQRVPAAARRAPISDSQFRPAGGMD